MHWNCLYPGKNTGVGCYALLQGSFPIQGLNPGLLGSPDWKNIEIISGNGKEEGVYVKTCTHTCTHIYKLKRIRNRVRKDIILGTCTQGCTRNFTRKLQFSCSVMSDSLWPHGMRHARLPCPSPTPGVYSNSCPLSWWCHLAISSSFVPFTSCPQSLPASGSFPMSPLFAWGGQSTGVSALASFLPKNTQLKYKL